MKHNFYAGPAILAKEVLAEASKSVVDLNDVGLSILEISHRSKEFIDIMDEAQSLVKEIYNLPSNYEVMFLQGGASTQFYMICMNFLRKGDRAGYVDTGSWSEKAIKEVAKLGDYEVLASSRDKGYSYIPKNYPIPQNLKYVHITSNNTISGTQYNSLPDTEVPIIADMSSDILSKPIDVKRFGLLYAGAQKNLGPAGTTLVIADTDFVSGNRDDIPTMVNYQTHIKKGSMFNTPPVFSIYVSMLTLRWIKKQGGLVSMMKKNRAKADLLYKAIDESSLFTGTATKEDRSVMNLTFLLKNEDLESKFLDDCNRANCIGIKGHRSVGGFRASIYNALDISSVQVLVDVIRNFDKAHG